MYKQYTPKNKVTGVGAPVDATVSEFWQWAFGDLCDDDIKGIFAEWVVTKILSIPSRRRISWANSDIITPDGIRIEIKASSYWQSWKLLNEEGHARQLNEVELRNKTPSCIRFSGLKARNSVVEQESDKVDYKSDLYIFCFQNETNPIKWNALDLEQWEFYVFLANDLKKFAGKSVSLKKLRERQTGLSAVKLSVEAKRLIEIAKGN